MSTTASTASGAGDPTLSTEYHRLRLQLEQAQREGFFATERITRLEADLAVARDTLRTATAATDALKRELRAITGDEEGRRGAH